MPSPPNGTLLNHSDIQMHFVFWAAMALIHAFGYSVWNGNNSNDSLILTTLNLACNPAFAYLHLYFVFPRLFLPRNNQQQASVNYLIYVFVLVFLGLINGYVFRWMAQMLFWDGVVVLSERQKELLMPAWNFPNGVFSMLLLTGLFYTSKWYHSSKLLQTANTNLTLQNKSLAIETDLIERDYSFLQMKQEKELYEFYALRWRINPHFLLGELNNLYNILLLKEMSMAVEITEKLSELMRYILYKCDKDKVLLTEEVQFLVDYIALKKMKYDHEDDLTIDWQVNDFDPALTIAPMILIVFVENAFKHGIERSLDQRWAKFQISVEDNELSMVVANNQPAKHKTTYQQPEQIGILNVRKRLKLVYENNHQLLLNSEADVFEVQLKMKLR